MKKLVLLLLALTMFNCSEEEGLEDLVRRGAASVDVYGHSYNVSTVHNGYGESEKFCGNDSRSAINRTVIDINETPIAYCLTIYHDEDEATFLENAKTGTYTFASSEDTEPSYDYKNFCNFDIIASMDTPDEIWKEHRGENTILSIEKVWEDAAKTEVAYSIKGEFNSEHTSIHGNVAHASGSYTVSIYLNK